MMVMLTCSNNPFFLLRKESKHPIFENMYKVLQAHPEFLAEDNDQGLSRVFSWKPDRNYAYFMESTSLEYYTERNCTVVKIGENIDERDYAIGMRKSKLQM